MTNPALARHWSLDPAVAFLNHGSFGATPRTVLQRQRELRDRMEAEPVRFFIRELPGLLEQAREEVASFVGARSRDLVFVPNATTGVNAVLRSFPLERGDEVVVTDHEYAACRNALDFVARRRGARVEVVSLPFPGSAADDLAQAVLAALSPRTVLVMVDHVTSPTGMVLPIERLVATLAERGVHVLVDGAHAPGMVPLALERLGASFYVANCHKWLCAPKGAGLLVVRADVRHWIRPTVIGHGATWPTDERPRLHNEFDWIGTHDPTAWLCVPHAIRALESMLPGGWPAVMQHNHALALQGRALLCEALQVPPPCPGSMIGAMVAVPLPAGDGTQPGPPSFTLPLQDRLLEQFGIEVPIIPWPSAPHRLVRISAQLYNHLGQVGVLVDALRAIGIA